MAGEEWCLVCPCIWRFKLMSCHRGLQALFPEKPTGFRRMEIALWHTATVHLTFLVFLWMTKHLDWYIWESSSHHYFCWSGFMLILSNNLLLSSLKYLWKLIFQRKNKISLLSRLFLKLRLLSWETIDSYFLEYSGTTTWLFILK